MLNAKSKYLFKFHSAKIRNMLGQSMKFFVVIIDFENKELYQLVSNILTIIYEIAKCSK